jgi:hypothetical protein
MRTLLVSCVVVALASGEAVAQDARVVKRVEGLNRAAMEDYDLLEFDSAKKQLADALALIKRHRLDKHAVAARTHMNLAIVYGAGLGDQDTALLELISALEIDPDLKLDAAYRSPALQKSYEQARASVSGEDPAAPPAPTGPALTHAPVEEAPAGAAITISVRAGREVIDRVTQVTLRFRPAGSESFSSTPMRSAGGGEFRGIIPESATRGDTVHYFVEARAATGKIMASAGSVDAPNIVSLIRVQAARPDDPPDDENPLREEPARLGAVEGSGTGGEPEETAVRRHPAVRRSFYFGVGVGSGLGYVDGETEVSHQAVTCCVAPAPLHVTPEIGFWLSRQLTLSLVGRIGFPLGANVAGAATLAPAGFLRATYLFGRDRGPYLHGDLGGGFIRHTIKLTRSSATTNQGDTDTYVTGPLLLGAGTGWIFPLGGSGLRFVVDLSVIAGIPIVESLGSGARASKPGFAIHGDLSLGMGFAF